MRVWHDPLKTEYRKPFGAVKTGTEIRLYAETDADSLTLCVRPDGYEEGVLMQMKLCSGDGCECAGISQIRRFEHEICPSEEGLIWYSFVWDDEEGVHATDEYQITVYRDFTVPKWYKDGIIYQIFPDRFARDEGWLSRCEENVHGRQFVEEDWTKPAYYERNEEGDVTGWPFYGGSLKGIEEKLDYLKSMGVTGIYLNPIFEAQSNHRYDTADYMKIDSRLGTEDDFRSLAKAARARGIRLILDGVFSHTGADSIYFAEGSPYRDWYDFDESLENGYRCWWGVKDLPEVDENNPSFRSLIGDVIEKWLTAGASGFRLDVADELPDDFIEYLRGKVKGCSNGPAGGDDNLLIGEVWEDASNKISYGKRRKFLYGNELDSVMNYPLRQHLLDYVNYTITAGEAAERIIKMASNYPKEAFYGALNILGSHDRERILTMMAAAEDYDSAAAKVKLLAVLQYALPGVPCIYYGDEAGLQGGADPENRNAFPWGAENPDLQYHYRQLGLLYDEHPVLAAGAIEMLPETPDDVLAFVRYPEKADDGCNRCDGCAENDERVLVLVNRSYGPVDVQLDVSSDLLRGGYYLELLRSEELNNIENIHMDRLSAKVILIKDRLPLRQKFERGAGVICHISSLPGGKLGKPARDFVDYIAKAGMKVWQVLPLNPNGIGDCPYNSTEPFAGNPDFINYDELPSMDGFESFCASNAWWLPADEEYRKQQYYFDCQWKDLRSYAGAKAIKLMGDIPMYVQTADTAGAAGTLEAAYLDRAHAGVPPDGFSDEGQDWKLPLYDWAKMKADGYSWWMKRLRQCAERFDIIRLDHFRGFSEYFAIPEEGTPLDGCWQHGPGLDFFRKVREELGNDLQILAEDLGYLDSGVKNLLKLTGFAGMNVWQFEADEMCAMTDEEASMRVFYAGTHDNDTLAGWCSTWAGGAEGADDEAAKTAAEDIIRKLYKSPAPLVMLQLQDVFLLGSEARMNVPGKPEGNWKWRLLGEKAAEAFAWEFPDAAERAAALRKLAETTERL